ncbi:MAG: hypothetical protein ACQCXQ_07735 [Verrucomicrobiales bacterium]
MAISDFTSTRPPIDPRARLRAFVRMAASLALCLALFPLVSGAEPLIEVRLDQPQQQIVVMGTDMERSANALQGAKNKEEIIKWVFEDTEGVDLLRVCFDKHQELERGRKNMGYYDLQVASMRQIKAVRPDIRFWATPKTDYDGYGTKNNLPDWIYRGGGYSGGRYDPNKLEVGLFAKFLADYLEHMQRMGVPIFGLSPMKEWSQVVSPEKTSDVIRALKGECESRRLEMPIIVGPASWSVKGGIRDLKKVKKLGDAHLYAGFSTHQYQGAGEADMRRFVELAEEMGQRAFDDETNIGGGGRTHGVEPRMSSPVGSFCRRARGYRAGLAGELVFEIWSRGINSETRSIYFKRNGVAKRMRAYWLFRAFASTTLRAHYIPSGLVTPREGVETMAFLKGDDLTLWVMNQGEEGVESVDIALKGGQLKRRSGVEVLRWSEEIASERGESSVMQAESETGWTVEVPPVSITRIRVRLGST